MVRVRNALFHRILCELKVKIYYPIAEYSDCDFLKDTKSYVATLVMLRHQTPNIITQIPFVCPGWTVYRGCV